MIVLCIVVVLLIGVICFFVYRKNNENTIVLLDINPSFEIVLDGKEKVVEVKGLNDDAKKVIDYGMNTDSLDEVLNSIIVGWSFIIYRR